VNSAIEAIVGWDPKSATEAELRNMEQNLDQLGMQVAQARVAYDQEKREADAIMALSNQRMAAAEQLQSHIAAEADPRRKRELGASLSSLVGILEEMAPDVEREKQDATDAREFLEMLESTYQQAGQKLRLARADLTRAQRDMSRAEQQRQVAAQREEGARQAAGLAHATSGLNVALKAMQDNATRSREQADAAYAKIRMLKPTRPEQDDPNIALAMAQVSGMLRAPSNITGRLAALRQKQLGGP